MHAFAHACTNSVDTCSEPFSEDAVLGQVKTASVPAPNCPFLSIKDVKDLNNIKEFKDLGAFLPMRSSP